MALCICNPYENEAKQGSDAANELASSLSSVHISDGMQQIGEGASGSMWITERKGETSARVYKLRNGATESSNHEFEIHNRVVEALSMYRIAFTIEEADRKHILVPRCLSRVSCAGFGSSREDTLVIERILPLKVPENLNLTTMPGRSYLIRPCLSLRDHTKQRTEQNTGQYLCLDPFRSGIGESAFTWSRLMGESLAVLHWRVGIDAAGVKFMLGSPRGDGKSVIENALGQHSLWMFGFDQCRPINLDKHGVTNAVSAFLNNGPTCPRTDSYQWPAFQQGYKLATKVITRSTERNHISPLAQAFLRGIYAADRAG